MAATFTKIATVTVGSGGASSIEFTAISASYTDLQILVCSRTNRSASVDDSIKLEFNGVTTNLSSKRLLGSGSATSSSSFGSNIYYTGIGASTTSSVFDNVLIYIPNYASSNYKSVSIDSVTENNATEAYAQLTAGLWSSTSAITSIKLLPNTGPNFVQYSTATLYGIKNS